MTIISISNKAFFLGANNKVDCTFEAPQTVETTYLKGTALVQKTADGTKFQLHSANLTLPIQGVLLNDITVPAEAGVSLHNVQRVIDGPIDQKLFVANNSIATIDTIPVGGTYSYRVQLENKGMLPLFREAM